MRDVRFAFRTLFRTPFVTAVAVLSLALGIGANAAIYSLFDQVLLRPLPVVAPDELVNISMPGPIRGSDSCNQSGGCDVIFSYPMFRDIERGQDVLAGIAGHRIHGVSIAMGDGPITWDAVFVTCGYFPTLRVRPLAYMPMQSRVWVGGCKGLESRRDFWVCVFGRLKPGVSAEAAKAGLDRVTRPILVDVEAPLQLAGGEQTMARFGAKAMVVEPGRRGQSAMQGEARTPVAVLFAITLVVPLIACAKIANLLLVRGAGRTTELGVHGDHDQVVPIAAAGLASAKLVRGSTLKVYAGAPHGLTDTHKERLNADLLAFVQR